MQPKEDKFSFEFINKALGFLPKEKAVKPEEDPLSPAYVSVDPWTNEKWTGE